MARRIAEAKFPKLKTLEECHFDEAPIIPAAQIRHLAEGGYLSQSEPIILVGVCQSRTKFIFSKSSE